MIKCTCLLKRNTPARLPAAQRFRYMEVYARHEQWRVEPLHAVGLTRGTGAETCVPGKTVWRHAQLQMLEDSFVGLGKREMRECDAEGSGWTALQN